MHPVLFVRRGVLSGEYCCVNGFNACIRAVGDRCIGRSVKAGRTWVVTGGDKNCVAPMAGWRAVGGLWRGVAVAAGYGLPRDYPQLLCPFTTRFTYSFGITHSHVLFLVGVCPSGASLKSAGILRIKISRFERPRWAVNPAQMSRRVTFCVWDITGF